MLKKIKRFKFKKNEKRKGKILIHDSKWYKEPKFVLRFFTKIHPVYPYEEVSKTIF